MGAALNRPLRTDPELLRAAVAAGSAPRPSRDTLLGGYEHVDRGCGPPTGCCTPPLLLTPRHGHLDRHGGAAAMVLAAYLGRSHPGRAPFACASPAPTSLACWKERRTGAWPRFPGHGQHPRPHQLTEGLAKLLNSRAVI